ncbi:MAG TPA: hypothetical protein VK889_09810 [Solirubrobacterales bacterium]|nr:hypothetical protein [Solirubrobacterales bacterium]
MPTKTMMLVGLAWAALALAGPAAAQAEGPFWWEDDNEVEKFLEEPKEAGPGVEFTFTIPAVNLIVGPCESGKETVWGGVLFNTSEAGEGKFFEGGIEGSCPTNDFLCTMTATPEFNWFLKLEEGELGEPLGTVTEVSIRFVPEAGCETVPEFTIAGEMTGAFENGESKLIFEKEEESGLLVSGVLPAEVEGEMSFGTNMTAK